MKKLTINLQNESYDILIEKGLLEKASDYIKDIYQNKNIYIITDSNVSKYYLEPLTKNLENANYNVKSIIVEAGEASKSFDTYVNVCTKLIDLDIRRNELLIALGGGVIGDLTGFIASTIYRGVPYVGIPTSLLAQMDSSIGGKTGVDFYNRKNIIGAFKQPLRVIIDPNTLNTLPHIEFINGLGELIKHGAIGNKGLIDSLNTDIVIDEHVISESLSVKKRVVELDPFDQKERMILNFGHTFGHVIEMKDNLKHGIAVANGMLMAIQFGIDLKITNEACYNKMYELLIKFNFPIKKYNYHDYIRDIIYDKKNLAGVISFILIDDFGHTVIKKINEEDIKRMI